jgi:hypothetical protein
MKWAQHGRYSLRWQGDILIASYEGDWNEVAAQNLHRDARAMWLARGTAPWGLLSDARQWNGATPEAFEKWWEFFEDGVRHGMVAATDILPTSFHSLLVSPLAERASQRVSYQPSSSFEEAEVWLNSQLLKS